MSLELIAGAGAALAATGLLAWALRPSRSEGTTTAAAIADPNLLAGRRRVLAMEHVRLEGELDLQRGVFEVSSELVGCVDERDLKDRLGAALARYWRGRDLDLMVWERGTWRGVGGEPSGPPPDLGAPTRLPGSGGDLVLDLSPAVDGQAVLVLRGAEAQPPLIGLEPSVQRGVAEVLRGQFALSLRRVVLYRSLQELARSDPLTGTCRRWYAEARLAEMVAAGGAVSVCMVDIDHFKRVNDGWGHIAGDRVLAAVGRGVVECIRHEDLAARMGGEEFLVLLPGTVPIGAVVAAERLRSAVAQLQGLPCPVTVSVGVATRRPEEPAAELLKRADAALYRAKKDGRDRVVADD